MAKATAQTTIYRDALIGGRNLITKSDVERYSDSRIINGSSSLGTLKGYVPSSHLVDGEEYTISFCITPAEGVTYVVPRLSDGYKSLCTMYTDGTTNKQIISGTFTAGYADGMTPDVQAYYGYIYVYRYPNDDTVTGITRLHWCKVEKGNKATDWTPAPEDMTEEVNSLKTSVETAQDTLVSWCHENDKTLINGSKIYTGSVKAEQIAAGTITGDKIAAGTLTAENIDVESLFSQRIEADNLDVIAGELQLSTDRLSGKDSYIDLFALDNGGEFDFKMTPYAITSWWKETALQNYYSGHSIVTPDKFEIKACEPDGTMTSAVLMDTTGVHAGNADLTGSGLEVRDATGRKFSVGVNGVSLQLPNTTTEKAHIWIDYAADAGGYQMSLNAKDIIIGGNLYRQGNTVFDSSMTIPVTNGGTGYGYRWTNHTFTINEEAVTELATPLVRYYPYLGLAFIRIAVKTTVSTAAGGTLKLGTLSCQPSYMQPVSGYATKELDAYVSYSDSSVNIRAREAISSGYEIRINGWITIQ